MLLADELVQRPRPHPYRQGRHGFQILLSYIAKQVHLCIVRRIRADLAVAMRIRARLPGKRVPDRVGAMIFRALGQARPLC